ncbi:MAG: dethiobiotin synthase [Planctomycetota bacterium]
MLEAPDLTKPGLFVTGTDTDVGKTVVSCAIAAALQEQQRRLKLGVLKPFATGCRVTRDGLINEDAEALAHFSGCAMPLELINPIRFRTPVAPAVAAEKERRPIDWSAIRYSLSMLDQNCDAVLVEGVGGLMVPLDPRFPRYMVGQFAEAIGYPVVVVCRATLGTLNHTAMTVELLRQAGCRVSGLVMNGMDLDEEKRADDPSIATNRDWLERITGVKVLAFMSHGRGVSPAQGKMDPGLIADVSRVPWLELMRVPLAC